MVPENCDEDADDRLRRVLGDVLLKATYDQFSYCAKLRTGEVVYFWSATYEGGDWIFLDLDPEEPDPLKRLNTYPHGLPVLAPRGVSVRLSDIVWAVDAPHGS